MNSLRLVLPKREDDRQEAVNRVCWIINKFMESSDGMRAEEIKVASTFLLDLLASSAADLTEQELNLITNYVPPSLARKVRNFKTTYTLNALERQIEEGDFTVQVNTYSLAIRLFSLENSDDGDEYTYDGVLHHYYTEHNLILVCYNQIVEIQRFDVHSVRTK